VTIYSTALSILAFGVTITGALPPTGETVGTQLARHKDIQLISLTGSMRAGKAVFENAASTVKIELNVM
jgi:acyl-CoA reductase-like NAD-dependent aldehyde dehydrogenase